MKHPMPSALPRGSLSRLLGCGLAGLAAALAATSARSQDLASLGEARITAAEIRHLAERPQVRQQILSSEQNFEAALRQMLIRRALAAEAQAKGWDKRPEVVELIEDAKISVIVSSYLASVSPLPEAYPDEAEVKAVYEQNREHLVTPRSYHLAQIFVRRDPAQAEAGAKRAAGIASKAAAADADFAALARAESEDEPTRARGGDTGWIAEPNLLPELRGPVQQMKPGQVGAPVPTAQGWHIVKLIESRPAAPATLDEARATLVNELRARRQAELRQAYVDALAKKFPVTIDKDALAHLRAELKP